MMKLRKALAPSVSYVTLAGVLLQKQAQRAVGLLPQWLSGYAFFFTMDMNLDRPKEMKAVLAEDFTSAAGVCR